MPSSICLPRPRFLTSDALECIHTAAVKILDQTGLRVLSPEAMDAAARLGLRRRDDRVFFEKRLVDEFAAESGLGSQPQAAPFPSEAVDSTITLGASQYANHVHDIDTDQVVPMTSARLIEMTKFVDTLAPFGVSGKAPGEPTDVPPELQALQKYRIGALYSRQGRWPVDIESACAMPFQLDMAEALGHPITSAPVYVVSPLTLGGSSLEYALAGKGRLQSLGVSNMSSLGATAPIRLGDALALGVAEVIGSAILAREATGLPVGWSVRVCPFEPRAMAMTLGAPEETRLQFIFEELNAWYHGREPGLPSGGFHTQAKLPDQQSAVERLSQMLTYALLGTRAFYGVGQLSLDEIFSPEQAMLDIEMRDHVQRLVSDLEVDCDPEACAADIASGVTEGFLALDSTARLYPQANWMPRLFFRGARQQWQLSGSPNLRTRAKDAARRQLAQHEYELPLDLQRELDRIYAAATRALT